MRTYHPSVHVSIWWVTISGSLSPNARPTNVAHISSRLSTVPPTWHCHMWHDICYGIPLHCALHSTLEFHAFFYTTVKLADIAHIAEDYTKAQELQHPLPLCNQGSETYRDTCRFVKDHIRVCLSYDPWQPVYLIYSAPITTTQIKSSLLKEIVQTNSQNCTSAAEIFDIKALK